MAKKSSAFSSAQAAVMKAFHDLERAVGITVPAKAKKAKARKAPAKAKKKTTKKASKRAR